MSGPPCWTPSPELVTVKRVAPFSSTSVCWLRISLSVFSEDGSDNDTNNCNGTLRRYTLECGRRGAVPTLGHEGPEPSVGYLQLGLRLYLAARLAPEEGSCCISLSLFQLLLAGPTAGPGSWEQEALCVQDDGGIRDGDVPWAMRYGVFFFSSVIGA